MQNLRQVEKWTAGQKMLLSSSLDLVKYPYIHIKYPYIYIYYIHIYIRIFYIYIYIYCFVLIIIKFFCQNLLHCPAIVLTEKTNLQVQVLLHNKTCKTWKGRAPRKRAWASLFFSAEFPAHQKWASKAQKDRGAKKIAALSPSQGYKQLHNNIRWKKLCPGSENMDPSIVRRGKPHIRERKKHVALFAMGFP